MTVGRLIELLKNIKGERIGYGVFMDAEEGINTNENICTLEIKLFLHDKAEDKNYFDNVNQALERLSMLNREFIVMLKVGDDSKTFNRIEIDDYLQAIILF